MSNRVWGSLSPSAGRRYWSDLSTAPGIVSPTLATLTIGQLPPVVFQTSQVFRTPSTALLTIAGLMPSSQLAISPAKAQLNYGGLIPVEVRSLTITPATPLPDYSTVNDLTPTIIYVQTVSPTSAQLALATLTQNVTQGGNIGFINPSVGLVSMVGQIPNFVFHEIINGVVTIQGLAPTILTERTITPDVGSLSSQGNAPAIETAFIWVDVISPPPLTWRVMT